MRLKYRIIIALAFAMSFSVAGYCSNAADNSNMPNLVQPVVAECEGQQCLLPTKQTGNLDTNKIESQSMHYSRNSSLADGEVIDESIFKNNDYFILAQFWALGLLLGFTPCVLPLIILMVGFLGGESSVIPRKRMILFVMTYVLALSVTYASLGVVIATGGSYLQAYFQNPWVLATTSIVIFFLSLSLMGFYEIRLPRYLRHIVVRHNKFQSNYQFLEVAVMGVLATLIASPCIAAPLAIILGYIASTGSVLLGGLSLFFVGVGVGTPLIIASIFHKEILPKPGKWQYILTNIFALTMICFALILSASLMPAGMYMALWSLVIIFFAIYIGTITFKSPNINVTVLMKSIVIMLLVYGIAVFVGSLIGNKNPTNPLQLNSLNHVSSLNYLNAANNKELDKEISESLKLNRAIFILFVADWCSACRSFQENVLNTEIISSELRRFTLLKVDLTRANTPAYDIARRYKVPGSPYVILIDSNGYMTHLIIEDGMNSSKLHKILHEIQGSE